MCDGFDCHPSNVTTDIVVVGLKTSLVMNTFCDDGNSAADELARTVRMKLCEEICLGKIGVVPRSGSVRAAGVDSGSMHGDILALFSKFQSEDGDATFPWMPSISLIQSKDVVSTSVETDRMVAADLRCAF